MWALSKCLKWGRGTDLSHLMQGLMGIRIWVKWWERSATGCWAQHGRKCLRLLVFPWGRVVRAWAAWELLWGLVCQGGPCGAASWDAPMLSLWCAMWYQQLEMLALMSELIEHFTVFWRSLTELVQSVAGSSFVLLSWLLLVTLTCCPASEVRTPLSNNS